MTSNRWEKKCKKSEWNTRKFDNDYNTYFRSSRRNNRQWIERNKKIMDYCWPVEFDGTEKKTKDSRKDEDQQIYKCLRNRINREASQAREKYLEDSCTEIEENMMKGNTDTACT